jgi:DNA replication and repair protein RecF
MTAESFRNFAAIDFKPAETVNIVYGDNAQGKTNLLEAIWLFTGAKSFRGAKDSELIKFGSGYSRLELGFFAERRSQTMNLRMSEKGKDALLNEVKQERVSSLAGIFCVVVFSPDHLTLVKAGPEHRRKMVDASLSQAYPKYASVLDYYSKTLLQRNRLLKDASEHVELLGMLDAWDQNLIEYGAYLSRMRDRYTRRLAELAGEIYGGISMAKEQLHCTYLPSFGGDTDGFTKDDYKTAMATAVKKSRAEDLRLGSTQIGPHRDDIEILVNGVSARSFGSQGQQRSCVLALKLAECKILEDSAGEPPVILLDDVMSELDESRRLFLLNQLDGRQVFITCCDRSSFEGLSGGKIFKIEAGEITQ